MVFDVMLWWNFKKVSLYSLHRLLKSLFLEGSILSETNDLLTITTYINYPVVWYCTCVGGYRGSGYYYCSGFDPKDCRNCKKPLLPWLEQVLSGCNEQSFTTLLHYIGIVQHAWTFWVAFGYGCASC